MSDDEFPEPPPEFAVAVDDELANVPDLPTELPALADDAHDSDDMDFPEAPDMSSLSGLSDSGPPPPARARPATKQIGHAPQRAVRPAAKERSRPQHREPLKSKASAQRQQPPRAATKEPDDDDDDFAFPDAPGSNSAAATNPVATTTIAKKKPEKEKNLQSLHSQQPEKETLDETTDLCAACGREVTEYEDAVVVDESKYHDECLTCAECGVRLESVHELPDGRLVCAQHATTRTLDIGAALGRLPTMARLQSQHAVQMAASRGAEGVDLQRESIDNESDLSSLTISEGELRAASNSDREERSGSALSRTSSSGRKLLKKMSSSVLRKKR